MGTLNLRSITLLNTSSAGAGSSIDLDWRLKDAETVRSITVSKNTSDTIDIQVSLDGNNWFIATTFSTGSTAGTALIAGPWAYIRANKTGTNGTATVVGFV